MKCKHLKLIMELIFIFILPLLFLLPSIKIIDNYVYDNNGNYESSDKVIDYDSISYYSEYCNVIENFNIWNERWELGSISVSTGLNTNDSERIRSVDYISVLPNSNYYFYKVSSYSNTRVIFYDIDKNFLSSSSGYASSFSFSTSSDVYFIRFACNGITYNNDICINISVSWANGYYVPYGESLVIYSDSNLSGDAVLVRSPLSDLKTLLIDILKLNNNNVSVNILFDYTCLWLIMFLIWHFIYGIFDFIVHLVDKQRRRE